MKNLFDTVVSWKGIRLLFEIQEFLRVCVLEKNLKGGNFSVFNLV